jgi:dTDP-4-amino-4,6-dideoxygalactose transaminase
MKAIAAAARSRGVAVIEDACHALGTIYTTGDAHEGIVGDCHFSDMAAFSLHPVKTVAMGEGGVITTNDTAVAKKLRLLRNHGLERDSTAWRNHDLAFDGNGKPNPWYYEMHQPGFNYRATDIHCALGLSQMKKLARFVGERRRLVGIYDRLIAHLAPAIRPITRPTGCEPGWHLYTVLIDYAAIGIARADLMRRLQRRGIGTQVHYIPVHRQPYYAHHLSTPELPGARRFYERCLSLPLFPGMNEGDVMRVVDALSVEIGQDRRLDAGEKGLDR